MFLNKEKETTSSLTRNIPVFVLSRMPVMVVAFAAPSFLKQVVETGDVLESTVRKKMAAVHFTTIPCEPN